MNFAAIKKITEKATEISNKMKELETLPNYYLREDWKLLGAQRRVLLELLPQNKELEKLIRTELDRLIKASKPL